MPTMTRLLGRLTRIAAMDWGEVRTRAMQAVGQRWDRQRCRLGGSPFPPTQPVDGGDSPRFFFDPAEVPEVIRLLRERLPAECERIVVRADKICEHRFDLLGYENLSFGEEINWHLDPVNERCSPLRPWYKIPFLDFEAVGDAKVIWELNRHQHWVILAKAHLLTDERRYVDEIATQWRQWWASNPYPMGVNWASALEVGLRSMSWLWVRHLLAGSPALSGEFHDEITRGLGLNGRHLETYLSTYFSPNTHLLGEGVALFLVGLLVPEFAASKRWHRRGWNVVLEQAERQVLADGLHFERSTYYHVYALDFFLHARILASRNGLPVPAEFDRVLNRQLDLLRGLSLSGTVFRFGDDDGGRVFDGARNRGEHLLDPLATGAALFARPELKASAHALPEETAWLLGEEGVRSLDELEPRAGGVSSTAFRQSKLYVMTACEPVPRKVLIVPGVATALGGGHAHADLLSLQLALNDKMLLDDSGTFAYAPAESLRDRFRGTDAHSTLQVGERDQGLPEGPFSWRSLPDSTTELCVGGGAFDLFCGYHDGYRCGDSRLRHRRFVFSLRAGFVFVRDSLHGEGAHELDLRWQVAPEAKLTQLDPCTHLVRVEDQAELAVVTCADHGWESRIERGWTSPVYGKKESRPVLRFSREAVAPTDFSTLLCPVVANRRDPGSLRRLAEHSLGPACGGDWIPQSLSSVAGYEYSVDGQSHLLFFAAAGTDWQLLDWKSDASFLYCRLSSSLRRISEAIVVGGSYVHRGSDRHTATDTSGDHWGWQD